MEKCLPQSLAGVIRERLASIEARLAVGVRQEVQLAELNACGYATTLKNFRNELCRARKKVARPASVRPPPDRATAAQPPVARPGPHPLARPAGFHYGGSRGIDPADLV